MKSTFVLFVPLVLTLIGCSRAPAPDPRLDQLAARLDTLQSNVTDLYERNENRKSEFVAFRSNTIGFLETNLFLLKTFGEEQVGHDVRLMLLEAQLTNAWARQNARTPQVIYRPAAAAVGQIPANIVAQIRADAEQRYPTDYDMQLYIIKEQTDAWTKLHP